MQFISILILIMTFITGCGVKLPPEPLFATSPTNIDNEVTRRKNEKLKSPEFDNTSIKSENKKENNN
ncbi:hypothetical protein [Silvanigrella aquatica]|uniref:Lipoprotein n=1 Tax=Silvanigrella aquatica TaxID=1915309 RepID=A0A1L4CY36_9BACT|nr:hypothetical protein [Silvanigrella aquatica]APJ02854.1 hypothetical protein AXG55_02530 [Silvanigrella aquatica]